MSARSGARRWHAHVAFSRIFERVKQPRFEGLGDHDARRQRQRRRRRVGTHTASMSGLAAAEAQFWIPEVISDVPIGVASTRDSCARLPPTRARRSSSVPVATVARPRAERGLVPWVVPATHLRKPPRDTTQALLSQPIGRSRNEGLDQPRSRRPACGGTAMTERFAAARLDYRFCLVLSGGPASRIGKILADSGPRRPRGRTQRAAPLPSASTRWRRSGIARACRVAAATNLLRVCRDPPARNKAKHDPP